MPALTVGTASVDVLPRNPARKTCAFKNVSTTGQLIYLDNTLSGGLTVANAGYPLAAGEGLIFMKEFDGKDILQPWSAIASAAGGVLYYKEMAEQEGV